MVAGALHHRLIGGVVEAGVVDVAREDDLEVRLVNHARLLARRRQVPRSSDQFDRAFHAPMKTRKSLLYLWRNRNVRTAF